MATNDYHFITHWRVPGTREEIFDIIGDASQLSRWWPSVYLEVKEVKQGDANGLGRVIDLYTKGWLPYTLRWQFEVTDVQFPRTMALRAWGDFVGRGIWTFEQDGPWVDVTYDWKIRADKPLLRDFSFVMKPLFGANHRWAMARGEESLRLELARRHAATPEARELVAPPPGPTPTSPVPYVVGGIVALWLASRLIRAIGPRTVLTAAGAALGYLAVRKQLQAPGAAQGDAETAPD